MENMKNKTLLDYMELVVTTAKEHNLSNQFYVKTQNALSSISERLGITVDQALVFSLCMEFANKEKIYMSSVATMAGCSNIKTLAFMNEADELSRLRLMRRIRKGEHTYYIIPIDVVDAIKENRAYKPEPIENLSEDRFYAVMNKVFQAPYADETALQNELVGLLTVNTHIPFVSALYKHGIMDNCQNTWDVLMACVYANRLITFDDDIVGRHDWINYFTKSYNIRVVDFGHQNETMKIFRCNLIEVNNSVSLQNDYHYHYTNQAKRELFPNHNVVTSKSGNESINL